MTKKELDKTSNPIDEVSKEFNLLSQTIVNETGNLRYRRRIFIKACITYLERLKTKEIPKAEYEDKRVLEEYIKLKTIRDYLYDWIILEGDVLEIKIDEVNLSETVLDTLEKLINLYPPLNHERTFWSDIYFVFLYEVFLYIVAALLKAKAYKTLHEIYSTRYLLPSPNKSGTTELATFKCFQEYLPPDKFIEKLIKKGIREDIPFSDINQAELLTLLMAYIFNVFWHPYTSFYYPFKQNDYPFFIRARQKKNFCKLATIAGIDSKRELKVKLKESKHRYQLEDLEWLMNIDNIDTLE